MIQRVMLDLMGMKDILVINDEAHHCYREKPKEADDEDLKGDDKKEAEKNNEAARLWISGLAREPKENLSHRGKAVFALPITAGRGHDLRGRRYDERTLGDGG